MSFQRCEQCGREESAGDYCTFCRTAEYWLVEHDHGVHNLCPLGPSIDPLDQAPAHRTRYEVARSGWAPDPDSQLPVRRWLHEARPSRLTAPRPRQEPWNRLNAPETRKRLVYPRPSA